MKRFWLVWCVVLGCLLLSTSAWADSPEADAAAEKKIDQAVNQHYLATEFDKAETVLQAVTKACANRCSPTTRGRALMYLGIVRGVGKNDPKAARDAFQRAFAEDPKVELDQQLATPEIKSLFDEVKKAQPAAKPEKKEPPVTETKPPPEKTAPEKPAPVKPAPEETTEKPAPPPPPPPKKTKPAPPPPPPPPPPKPPGSCDQDNECESGEACMNKHCELVPVCDSDAQCGAGRCIKGQCSLRQWIGLHVAQDFNLGGGDACGNTTDFTCYKSGTDELYQGIPFGGSVKTGAVAVATTRVLLSYDIAFLASVPNLTLGARAGLAFRGGPPSADGTKFLPVHLEARGQYFFGSKPFDRPSVRPYVYAGVGMAQVDAKYSVTAPDCTTATGINSKKAACYAGDRNTLLEGEIDGLPVVQVDAYKKMGQGFAAAGGGVTYPFSPVLSAQGNLGLMVLFPTTGFVLEPSLGITLAL